MVKKSLKKNDKYYPKKNYLDEALYVKYIK